MLTKNNFSSFNSFFLIKSNTKKCEKLSLKKKFHQNNISIILFRVGPIPEDQIVTPFFFFFLSDNVCILHGMVQTKYLFIFNILYLDQLVHWQSSHVYVVCISEPCSC